MDKLSFFNSSWELFSISLTMTNSHTSFSMFSIRFSTDVMLANSTFGVWIFEHIQQIVMRNCSSNFVPLNFIDSIIEDPTTSLIFYNSSGLIENINIRNKNLKTIHDGIIVEYYSNIQITNSTFANNNLKYALISVLDFGTLIVLDSIMQENQAQDNAAAILSCENSTMNMTNTYFYLNSNKAVGGGGAICAANNSFLQIQNCIFENNQVVFGYGGGIHLRNNSRAEIHETYFTQNMARYGSAIYGIWFSTISCQKCLFYQNIIPDNTDAGAIQIQKYFTLHVIGLKCQGQMGSILSCISAYHYCNVFVYNSTFDNNIGSAIVLWNNTHFITLNSTFLNNSSPEYVAVIHSFNSTLTLSHSVFYHNEAEKASTILLDFSIATIKKSKFLNNSNIAITLKNKTKVSIKNSVFENNSNPGYGGAVFMFETCILNVSSTIFLQNYAENGGAVAAAVHSVLLMSNCSFYGNSAFHSMVFNSNIISGAGGTLFVKDSVLIISQSCFVNNYAAKGGSVYYINSSLVIYDTVLKNNLADSLGLGK